MTLQTSCGAERVKKIVQFTTRNQLYAIFGRALMEKLFSFYAIHGLHGAFRNVTQRINEKALYILCKMEVIFSTIIISWAIENSGFRVAHEIKESLGTTGLNELNKGTSFHKSLYV